MNASGCGLALPTVRPNVPELITVSKLRGGNLPPYPTSVDSMEGRRMVRIAGEQDRYPGRETAEAEYGARHRQTFC